MCQTAVLFTVNGLSNSVNSTVSGVPVLKRSFRRWGLPSAATAACHVPLPAGR